VFARITGLRPLLVHRLVLDPDGLGLAIAARAVGMSVDQVGAIYRITRHSRMTAPAEAPDEVAGLIAIFERIAAEDAARVCDYWRLPPEYLEAVWQVGNAGREQPAGLR
jgi:hypothetical protein